jgi:hypothetical protein
MWRAIGARMNLEKDAAAMEKSNKHGASAQFAKMRRANGASPEASEYETTVESLRAKSAKLKALRLARDAAAPPPAPKRKAKSRTSSKTPSGSLSNWLDGQAKEGRRS